MALSTYSKFYYGFEITENNRYLDFNDGSDKAAVLTMGSYSAQGLCDEIKKQMDALSSLDFTVTFDRSMRKITIATTVNFILKVNSGVSFGVSVFTLIGFTGADRSAATSYLGDTEAGLEYKPQCKIQSYKPTNKNRKAIDGVINKSASGEIEVIKFGDERFADMEFVFITDISQETGSIIRTNTNAVDECVQFIEDAIEKNVVEFMPDENLPATFQTFILESTDADPKGLDYSLIELYDRDLAEYFRSGNLKFRLIEV
jgi:hypothetical protein